MRILIDQNPYPAKITYGDSPWDWQKTGLWPCAWVSLPDAPAAPFVSAYRRRFDVDADTTVTAHVSADERYELYLDGQRIGRGPERGEPKHWHYESYRIPLKKGPHCFVARVWTLGRLAPFAQLSLRPGFLFATDEKRLELLATGRAPWEAKLLDGYTFVENPIGWGTGATEAQDGARLDWGFEKGDGEGWRAVVSHEGDEAGDGARRNEYRPTRLLYPATLPAMLEAPRSAGTLRKIEGGDAGAWRAMLQGQAAVTISAGAKVSVLLDLEDYCCAYPELLCSGGRGSQVELFWAESLFVDAEGQRKGNRDEVEGKHFIGYGDSFKPDGGRGRLFETLWWRAGRYLRLNVTAGAEALSLEGLRLRETHYPLAQESSFSSSDARLEAFIPLGLRGLQMCAHETYMDCPYYEQLMYVGDTRLECLVTYALTRDSRLPQKALQIFDQSRIPSGLTQSRYPSRITQVIPPFSLWWVAMVHDHALWRGNPDFVRGLMPGVRAVIDALLSFRNRQGLLEGLEGWNFMDWVPAWPGGVPPQGEFGANATMNWQGVYVLQRAAELEAWLGEKELAQRDQRLAKDLAKAVSGHFWSKQRGLFSEDLKGKQFAEHSQCLALLSGHLDSARKKALAKPLFAAPGLDRTTIYFTHYLFEACRELGRMDVFFQRLELWHEHSKLGMKTTLEAPEPSRSDCHAWGAHPLYHYFATVLGIRPAAFGFESVLIRPQLGPLSHAEGRLVHPRGVIAVEVERKGKGLRGKISLPKGVSGVFLDGKRRKVLAPGKHDF
jgi:hypothetical protein